MPADARYAHTNLVTRDWRRLAAFYYDVFGCRRLGPVRNLGAAWLAEGTGVPGARIEGQHLLLPGHGEDGPTLEVFAYADEPDALDAAANRPGWGHIAFCVDHVAAMREAVLAAGGGDLGHIVTATIPGVGTLTFLHGRAIGQRHRATVSRTAYRNGGQRTMKRSLGAKSIAYPTPVFVVGTYDAQGQPNIMAAAWAGICCSRPPCLAVALRAATYTHGNIVARKAFTVSIPSADYVREADYAGIASGRDGDKFAAAGLTAVASDLVDAPYVNEFPFVLECRLLHTIELGLHTQFIGEIVDIKAEESALDEHGHVDIERVHPFLFAPGNSAYYAIGERLGTAFSIGRDIAYDDSGNA